MKAQLRQHLLDNGVVAHKVTQVLDAMKCRGDVTLWELVRAAANCLCLDLCSPVGAEVYRFSVQGMMQVGLTPEAAFNLVHSTLRQFPSEEDEDFVYHYSCGHWLSMHLERSVSIDHSPSEGLEDITATYDAAADALAVRFTHGVIHETDPCDAVNIDLDRWGHVVALEVLDFASVTVGGTSMRCCYNHAADSLELWFPGSAHQGSAVQGFADTFQGSSDIDFTVQTERVHAGVNVSGRVCCLRILCASDTISNWHPPVTDAEKQINLVY